MIEMYCDACGSRITGQKYIKAKVNVGDAKNVLVHAYAPERDLCQTCLVMAVNAAKEKAS